MKKRDLKLAAAALAGWLVPATATKAASDILPPARRQQVVDLAQTLAQPPAPKPVPEDLPQPFNPPDFEKPAADETRPIAAPGAPAEPAGPAGDREILETLAARLVPSGTFVYLGKPQLVIGKNRFPVGTKFTVTFNAEDYELELVSIDRTTFTLRYRGEEITRPIKPVR